jgi:hypothetical protein
MLCNAAVVLECKPSLHVLVKAFYISFLMGAFTRKACKTMPFSLRTDEQIFMKLCVGRILLTLGDMFQLWGFPGRDRNCVNSYWPCHSKCMS